MEYKFANITNRILASDNLLEALNTAYILSEGKKMDSDTLRDIQKNLKTGRYKGRLALDQNEGIVGLGLCDKNPVSPRYPGWGDLFQMKIFENTSDNLENLFLENFLGDLKISEIPGVLTEIDREDKGELSLFKGFGFSYIKREIVGAKMYFTFGKCLRNFKTL